VTTWNGGSVILHRREAFKLIAAFLTLSSGCSQTRRGPETLFDEKTFFVAGARFYKHAFGVSTGDRVVIKPAIFRNQRSLEVLTVRNERIGYVPRSLVSLLSECEIIESYISSSNKHTVPWKRYAVTVKATF
jgi:hypothetical protein